MKSLLLHIRDNGVVCVVLFFSFFLISFEPLTALPPAPCPMEQGSQHPHCPCSTPAPTTVCESVNDFAPIKTKEKLYNFSVTWPGEWMLGVGKTSVQLSAHPGHCGQTSQFSHHRGLHCLVSMFV